MQIKGKGADVANLDLRLAAPVIMQVVYTSTGTCAGDAWDAIDLNDAATRKFKARRR